MSFASPWLLLSLLALPLVAGGYRLLERRRARASAAWARRAMLPNLVSTRARRLRHLPALLLLVGLTFLLVGFARPQQRLSSVRGGAPTVVLTFDVSGSMASSDIAPSRIRAAHAIAARFVRTLPSTARVAIVTFADTVKLVDSPTFDRARILADLPNAVTPLAGTRIGDGIDDAVSVAIDAVGKGYPGDPYRPGAVLLFSDGAQTAGGPTPGAAANTAYLDGVPIDTVILGTPGGVVSQPLKVDGQTVPNQIRVPVYPQGLESVSHTSAGQSIAVTSAAKLAAVQSALAKVTADFAATALPGEREHELTTAAAALALAFILAGVLLSAFWFGSVA